MIKKGRNRFVDSQRVHIYGDWCVYCGELATSKEHFPPATLTPKGVIFPACKECNGFAGTSWGADWDERCRHVKDRLRSRYRELLETPEWSTDEQAALGYTLQKKVKGWEQQRKLLLKRLAWNVADYLSLIDRNNDFGMFLAETGIAIKPQRRKLKPAAPRRTQESRSDYLAALGGLADLPLGQAAVNRKFGS